MRRLFAWMFLAVVALIGGAACTENGTFPITTPTTLRLSPSQTTVRAGDQINFTAFSDGGQGQAIIWSASGGTITSSGVYTAPAAPGNYTVRARFSNDANVTATSTVTVTNGLSLNLSPMQAPVMAPNSRLTFVANVMNSTSSSRVLWTATGGRIDTDGLFIADDAPGPYSVTARSIEDPTVVVTISGEITRMPKIRMTFEGKGTIVMQLDATAAPRTVQNFVDLCNQHFYDDIILHRYEVDFVIQGGDPQTKTLPLDDPRIGQGGPGYTIPFENSPLLHDKYAVAMALNSPGSDTAGSQFYITLDPQPSLDGDYCVFGNVIEGMTVVDALRRGDRIVSAVTEL